MFPVLVSEGGPKFEKFSSSMAENSQYAQRWGTQGYWENTPFIGPLSTKFNNMIDSKFSSMFDAYSFCCPILFLDCFNPHTRKPVIFF